MLQTKLILLDGVPGSGKSTLAQTLLRHLRRQGIPARWWYEEDAAHPVYVFHDSASLRHVLAELSSGQHPHVVTRALAQWQHFVDAVQAEEEVVLLDGCLFGYLTWSLFPLALPAREIRAYLAAVERIIAPLAPCLLYLYQDDLAASFRRVFASRGPTIERAYIRNVEESPYGALHGLRGFAGLVRYWADYRALTDAAFAALPWDKIALETTSGAWQTYERRVLDVLDLPPADTADGIGAGSPADLRRFAGAYRSIDDAPPATCTVHLGDTGLLLDGMPEVWPDTRLVPTGPSVFDVASLPIEISFGGDTAGGADTMTVGAPEFLGGSIPKAFERERLDSTDASR
jgi:thymidylate kinase